MEHERILYLLDYLTRYTNEKRTVTIHDIRRYLEQCGNLSSVSPLTIRRDIDRLILAGYAIEITNGAHNTAHYRLTGRTFTFNEIRFIVDSVSINRFLSNAQKKRLVKKFEQFCSEEDVRKLISRITLNEQSGTALNLLENLDRVHNVISEQRKIHFEYGKYDTERQVRYYSKKREMIPCRIVYFNERFYLKCVDEATGAPRTYRIDRMRRISAGDQPKKKAQLPVYDAAVTDIFEPEECRTVHLRVNRVLLDDMLEQFGQYATVLGDDQAGKTVELRVRVGISHGFYRWLMKYGSDVELLAPKSIRKEFSDRIQAVAELYK